MHRMTTRSKSGIVKTKALYNGVMCTQSNESCNSIVQRSTTVNILSCDVFKEPNLADEALKVPQWKESMVNEFAALSKNKTWVLGPYDSNQRVLDCK